MFPAHRDEMHLRIYESPVKLPERRNWFLLPRTIFQECAKSHLHLNRFQVEVQLHTVDTITQAALSRLVYIHSIIQN